MAVIMPFSDAEKLPLWMQKPSTSTMKILIRRYAKALVALFVFLACFWVFLNRSFTPLGNSPILFTSEAALTHPLPKSKEAHDFWQQFAAILAKGQPSFPEVRRGKEGANPNPWVTFLHDVQPTPRPDNLILSDAELQELKDLYGQAVEDLRAIAGNLPFNRGTRGIVTTANNDAFAILTTSLWVLRSTGSQLPVEIWLYDYESYEEAACEDIFPSLGAKCMFMVDYLPEKLEHPLKIIKFTFKTLAMSFSTFEQLLFIDCDAFPVMNPDSMFDTNPFKRFGTVLWPDYWAETSSHYLYEIVGQQRIPDLKERSTTESGELLLNKGTHAAPLLLATWFNVYGPEYWYRLVSQNAPGEGDKDLFRFALEAFSRPWFQVWERPSRLGYKCNGRTQPIGTGQSHPTDDWVIRSNDFLRDWSKEVDFGTTFHPRILFIHGNLPKYDAMVMLDWDIPELEWRDILRCDNGTGAVHRLLGPPEITIPKYGWDVEKQIWNAMIWAACMHEKDYRAWTAITMWREHPRTDLCVKMTQLWKEHFPHERWSRTVPHTKHPGAERPWGMLRIGEPKHE